MEICHIKNLSSQTAHFNFARHKFSVKEQVGEKPPRLTDYHLSASSISGFISLHFSKSVVTSN